MLQAPDLNQRKALGLIEICHQIDIRPLRSIPARNRAKDRQMHHTGGAKLIAVPTQRLDHMALIHDLIVAEITLTLNNI